MTGEVSLAEREIAMAAANLRIQVAAEEWCDARAGGRVSPALDAELDEAIRDHARCARKLHNTRKRLGVE